MGRKRILYTEKEIKEMQEFYDDGHSLREIQKKFNLPSGGYQRSKLIKSLKINPHQIMFSDEERKQSKTVKVIKSKQKLKQRLVEYKGGKCQICGYNKCLSALVFHHTDPSQKEFSIGTSGKGYEKCLTEINKCQLLCCNCHAEIHTKILVPINNSNCSFPDQRLVN